MSRGWLAASIENEPSSQQLSMSINMLSLIFTPLNPSTEMPPVPWPVVARRPSHPCPALPSFQEQRRVGVGPLPLLYLDGLDSCLSVAVLLW